MHARLGHRAARETARAHHAVVAVRMIGRHEPLVSEPRCDGIVRDGFRPLNESMLTGESNSCNTYIDSILSI